MLEVKTKADLQRLVDETLHESLTLDYKATASHGRSNEQRRELIKDVSAFANSAGGQIVYGIIEEGHTPIRIDDGT